MIDNIFFEDLIKIIPENQYIGLGNPNSKILFVGKEAGIKIGDENFHGSLKSWENKKIDFYSKKYVPKEVKIRNLNHTWQRYQKLYDCILSKLEIDNLKSDKYEINFIENVFTTELSNLHAPNTRIAKAQNKFSDELKNRKEVFFKSDFIKSFQIVVIFASDNKYIETYPSEICELFDVKFQQLHDPNSKDKIWVHNEAENSDKPKLLIHTRQLTNRITPELIPSICEIVAHFIKKNNINISCNKNMAMDEGGELLGAGLMDAIYSPGYTTMGASNSSLKLEVSYIGKMIQDLLAD